MGTEAWRNKRKLRGKEMRGKEGCQRGGGVGNRELPAVWGGGGQDRR